MSPLCFLGGYVGFFELVESGEKDFDGLDYAAPTPDFAVFGAPEAGFSPEDQRWFRKGKGPLLNSEKD